MYVHMSVVYLRAKTTRIGVARGSVGDAPQGEKKISGVIYRDVVSAPPGGGSTHF